MKYYLCPNTSTKEQSEAALTCIKTIEAGGEDVCSLSAEDSRIIFGDESFCRFDASDADAVISVGGDGSLLRAAQKAISADKPLLGINGGHLGYLCALKVNDLYPGKKLLAGLKPSERLLLEFEMNEEKHFALNDVVVAKTNLGLTIGTEITVDSHLLTSWRGDGVILSTPTGSTSYNLSAGGPVLDASLNCIIITPICAHTMDAKPIVVNEQSEIVVRLLGDNLPATVLTDGVEAGKISDTVRVKASAKRLVILGDGKTNAEKLFT
ncbi:MAG: NAD(+)/NADH kinase [Clostridia bacterium]|nr:NAD(+)/NADH kinase [Clostridia bacterium]